MKDVRISADNMAEFVGQIIDSFEDFLEERHVHIPNPERSAAMQENGDTDSVAIIYGTDYGVLQSAIEDTLMRWGLVREENLTYTHFCDDTEKMIDFCNMERYSFLRSYSYLTAKEYDLTLEEINRRKQNVGELVTIETYDFTAPDGCDFLDPPMYFTVPLTWAINWVWSTLDGTYHGANEAWSIFLDEYTLDDTMEMYEAALADGVITHWSV